MRVGKCGLEHGREPVFRELNAEREEYSRGLRLGLLGLGLAELLEGSLASRARAERGVWFDRGGLVRDLDGNRFLGDAGSLGDTS